MTNRLAMNIGKCTGCRLCELACSVFHTGFSNPELSRIKVVHPVHEGPYLPLTCYCCTEAPCVQACPEKAISRDEEGGPVKIDYKKCKEGCKDCLHACPFDVMSFDEKLNKAAPCDYCNGDPQCVRFCKPKAIESVESDQAQTGTDEAIKEQIAGMLKKTAG